MNLEIEKNILLKALTKVSVGVTSRNIIPVLNGILFDLTNKGLSLTATDNDITIKTFIPKEEIKDIIAPGKMVIYGKYILDIVKKMPSDIILIEEVEGNKTIISGNNSKFDLNCLPLEDYPNIELTKNNNFIKIKDIDLKNMIIETVFATSTQESRPALTGINLVVKDNILECTATDSYRLAKKIIKLQNPIKEPANVIISSKNIQEMLKMLEGNDDILELHFFENKVMLSIDNLFFQTSLLNDTFPNTNNTIATDFTTQIEVNLSDIINVIDRASILNQLKDIPTINFSITENKIYVSSYSVELGKVEEIIEVNKIKGNDLKISFSSKYMLEALKTFKTEKILLLFNGEISPIIIRDKIDGELTQLILPIKTFI